MQLKKLFATIISILIFSFLVASSLHFKNNTPESKIDNADNHEQSIKKQKNIDNEHGICDKSYNRIKGSVKRNQNLSHILSNLSIDNFKIHKIANKMEDVFKPTRIRAGNSYYSYFKNDSLKNISYFIYDICPVSYLKINLTDPDSVKVGVGEKEVVNITKESSGIINSSLWNTMKDNDLSFDLAIRMSEILAWEVDFYRIEKGDHFKVIYDETYVDDTSIGIDEVHGIYFVHRGKEIYGFNYQKDTIDGFYDKEGENLQKIFLKAPLKYYRISSGYSHSRLHPITGNRRPHLGTDYAAPAGTPIISVGDGVVTETAYTSGNGNYVKIRHNSVHQTQYLHMSRFARGIRPGTQVEQGDVIGYVGSTGLATGPHVCFRFWKNGQQVNHRRLEFPSADPLPKEYFKEFFTLRDSLKERLDNIPFKEINRELISSN